MPPGNGEDSSNPLLLAWVKEWYDTAVDRNTKGVTTYRRAYRSLQKCPMRFEHPSQLKSLEGFGDGLCKKLTDRLQKYCDENNIEMPQVPKRTRKRKNASAAGAFGLDHDEDDAEHMSAPAAKKARKAKSYCPKYGSGAYALVVALSKQPEGVVGMSKTDLIEEAQQYTESSFTAPSDPNSFYTAWKSMETLLKKELVYERGRPTKRYALTDEGWKVAKGFEQATGRGAVDQGIAEDDENDPVIVDPLQDYDDDDTAAIEQPDYTNVVANGSGDSPLPAFRPIILEPGTFEVRLVVDVREIRARTDRDFVQEELHRHHVRPLVRAMGIGDFQWVAQCHDPTFLRRHGIDGDEVVLDYCVERKRLDDLVSSIKEGRYAEQRFRLRRSGVKHVTYIVEMMRMDLGQMETTVESTIASLQAVYGFTVKKTKDTAESCRYLASMTRMLKNIYERKPLQVIPTDVITTQNYLPLLKHLGTKEPGSTYYITYPAFASLVSKRGTHTLRDLFLRMLLCVSGVTGEKALEIQKVWKTPNDFINAFENCGTGKDGEKKKKELVYTRLGNNIKSKQIGKILSAKIAETWAA